MKVHSWRLLSLQEWYAAAENLRNCATVSPVTQRRQEQRKELAARKKWKLAQKLDDAAMLVAALAFYCGRLEPGVSTPSGPIHAFYLELPRKWRPYLEASRRVLQIQYVDRETMRLPRNVWRCRLPLIGLKLHLHSEERECFENLNSDLVIDDAIRDFAISHPQLLERVQLFLSDGYRPSIPELLGREKHPSQENSSATAREAQRKIQFWLPGGGDVQEPGPFARHPAVDQLTRQAETDSNDNNPDDEAITFSSPRVKRISCRQELRAIEAEDRPETAYRTNSRRVICRPGPECPPETVLQSRHPYEPAMVEPPTVDQLMRGSIRAHLARKASTQTTDRPGERGRAQLS